MDGCNKGISVRMRSSDGTKFARRSSYAPMPEQIAGIYAVEGSIITPWLSTAMSSSSDTVASSWCPPGATIISPLFLPSPC